MRFNRIDLKSNWTNLDLLNVNIMFIFPNNNCTNKILKFNEF